MRAAQRLFIAAFAVPLVVAMLPGSATASAPVQVISTDPLTNTPSQHQTEVEPDTFANGSTIVSAFQVGRIYSGGADAIGWARSTDAGTTWSHGILPGLTKAAPVPGPYDRASDPVVAYDAKDGVWLAASLAMVGSNGKGVAVNRSTDGGATWGNAITAATKGLGLDKDWIVCDNTPTSPFYGHCYIEYDDNGASDLIYNSTSTDGGLTWSTPKNTADNARGLGGQPVVQPNGTVIVASANASATGLIAYRSTNGGTTWGASVQVTAIQHHKVHAAMRISKLPSAEIDGAGTVYLSWEDCRFRSGCKSNDIVISTSSDGLTWSAPNRVPIDPVTSTADHFIPGIGVDTSTSGANAHIAMTYYFYPVAACTRATCQLEVGQISSTSGLSGWGSPTTLTSSPMSTTWLAKTSQGRMVGDYISTSWVNGSPVAAFELATANNGAAFHEATAAGGA
jgi:hypothetical protein